MQGQQVKREKELVLEFQEETSMGKALWYERAYWVQEIVSKLEELQRKGVWSKNGSKERYKERQGELLEIIGKLVGRVIL